MDARSVEENMDNQNRSWNRSKRRKEEFFPPHTNQTLVPEAGLEPARPFQVEGFSCRTWSPKPASKKQCR
jgi:hypothetical protein